MTSPVGLTSIGVPKAQVSSCVFQLTVAPPDPTNIAVEVNSNLAPRDATHRDGWDYTAANFSQIEVFGTWCDQIKMAAANSVKFKLGCPGVAIK